MNKEKAQLFERNPKTTIIVFLVVVSTVILCLSEFYLGQSKTKMIRKGNSRYVDLGEPSPNSHINLKLDTNSSPDLFILNDSLEFETDKNGFIKPSFLKENNNTSIVFLGDGTTANLHLKPEDRFTYLTGKNLQLNTFNAGFPGNDIIHSINRLIGTIIPLKPKYVLLMHTLNDLIILTENGNYWDYEKNQKVKSFESLENENDFSSLLTLKKIRSTLFNQTKEIEETKNQTIKIDTSLIYKNYRSALLTFIAVCKDWHITPILMTQANLLDSTKNISNLLKLSLNNGLTDEEIIAIHRRFNSLIIQTAKSQSIHYIDLDQHLSNQPQYFYNELALKPEGSKYVSTIISDSLSIWINEN
ncbi:hypothetical protein GYB57_06755 [bacterium]|nr:hypothetical protein [bacterium]